MNSLHDYIEREQARQQADAERYAALDKDECMCCHAHGPDMRNLFVSCLYSIHEVVPEAIDLHAVEGVDDKGYYLRICKHCRARFLDMLARWFTEGKAIRLLPKDSDGGLIEDATDLIPVRVNGVVSYMMPEEYERWREARDDG